MNCKEIILDGIIKKKPVFGTYLFRKFEKSQYEADEFFFDCEAVFNQLKQVVSNKYNKQKSEFYNLLTYGTDEGKEYAKSELAQFNPDNYPYNLVEISPKYAGYFLTNSDLRIIKNGIDEAQKKAENKTLLPHQTETNPEKLKVPQIALIHFYEGNQITRDNAGEIAAKYGYTAKNSGEGLFQDYTNYCSTANRKGKPTLCTPKKLKNKIELFESVVNHLSENAKQRAIDEINILKTIFENEYQ